METLEEIGIGEDCIQLIRSLVGRSSGGVVQLGPQQLKSLAENLDTVHFHSVNSHPEY